VILIQRRSREKQIIRQSKKEHWQGKIPGNVETGAAKDDRPKDLAILVLRQIKKTWRYCARGPYRDR
jgi:hypothetical protein